MQAGMIFANGQRLISELMKRHFILDPTYGRKMPITPPYRAADLIESRLGMRGSNNLPDDHCVFRVFPQTSQAGRRVCGPWIVREFQNVRDRRGPEQTAEPIIAAG